MKRAFPVLVALVFVSASFASPSFAQSPPKCPDTHYPCGGNICCSR